MESSLSALSAAVRTAHQIRLMDVTRRSLLAAAWISMLCGKSVACSANTLLRPPIRKDVTMASPAFSTRTITIEHVTIASSNAFDAVRTKVEKLIPRIDDGIFTLLRYGESARALQEMHAAPPLSIFGFRDHGALLMIAGLRRQAIQYDIGNPLTASKMTRHQISAGLYAPVRVLLREDSEGGVAFEYDRPAAVFGQFGDEEVDLVAQQLDRNLQSTLEEAAA
jgi:uncharacterized protein (DUF302 family)